MDIPCKNTWSRFLCFSKFIQRLSIFGKDLLGFSCVDYSKKEPDISLQRIIRFDFQTVSFVFQLLAIISLLMNWHKTTLEISTRGKGLQDITSLVRTRLRDWGVNEGMCFLFLQHTSASLVISENWDPTARADLETFMNRLVPERDTWYTHDLEGPDDATSHIRSMLTDTSLTIPVEGGDLSLGTWQGIYIFEHRARPHQRRLLLRVLSVE
jgi:secondary thiamine-phosphate synthase enzyme